MLLGVVGNRAYHGLPDVLQSLQRLAPSLGLRLAIEGELHDLAPGCDRFDDAKTLDALLTLGGDGTMLRGARVLAGHQIPVLGVNLGKLGFLTTCGREELEPALRAFAAGEFRAEARMTLEAVAGEGNDRRRWTALNDIVIHKGGFARVVRLRVSANGDTIAAYAADGLVVATPTGSTAYSLSAGGPVVVPTVESIILTPISPHTLAIRPLVLPPSVEVLVQADDGPEELLVTVDGQVGTTFHGTQTLVIRRSDRPVQLVRFPGQTFFARLRRKLGWGGLPERDDHGR